MKKEKVLITGGAGFIGSHTADALARKGFKIRILDNLENVVHGGRWPKYVLGKGYELIRGDVRKKSDWAKALKGVSFVYHLAAYQDQRPDFHKFFEVNTVGTALLYELIVERRSPIKKVVIASSQFVYGDGKYQCPHNKSFFYPELRTLEEFKHKRFDILCSHGKPARFISFKEDHIPNPTNSYGLSKWAMESLSLKLGKTYGIPTTILRYSVVQGVRQSPKNLYSGALRIFVTQSLRGKPITVFEDGKQLRDFVSVKDVVAANLKVLENRKSDPQIFNVGGGHAWSVLRFAELVKKITGSKSRIKIGGFRRTDTRHAVSDISKLKKLGWRPRFSPLDSVREYLRWYKENSR
ncbi:MAG: NAD-dependent epimerase/dehydratase family protein [Candidatus Liptonbacteria bacterium]|nr:NAD-dependent epimerase/dehydratase family protein [Parcubacteria group bacterium]MBI4087369.1 NAD-dependent epimerase/dehydratase family protein [Candidatus Liptonbacteria bacterium]